jgi:hypothetical protein
MDHFEGKKYPYNEKNLTIRDLASLPDCNCTYDTLRARIIKMNWDIKKAVTKPARAHHREDVHIASEKEAWGGLNEEQFLTMCEFQKIGDFTQTECKGSQTSSEMLIDCTLLRAGNSIRELNLIFDLPIVEMS